MCKYVFLIILTVLFIMGIYILTSSKKKILGEKAAPHGVVKKKIKHHIPKVMLELYENRKSFGNFSRADVVRSLIPKIADKLQEENADSHLLVFEIPATKADEEFINAELRILTIVQRKTKPGVERIIKIWIYNAEKRNMFCLEELQVFHKNNTWLSFNVTTTVAEILQREAQNKTLQVIVSVLAFWSHYETSSGHLQLSLTPLSDDYEHEYPILLMSYVSKFQQQQSAGSRKKRNIEDDYEEETNNVWEDQGVSKAQFRKLRRYRNICKKKPLYIDFEEIHYDEWIIQPRGYEAYQCQGKCFYPIAEHLHPTKHAIMQTLLHGVAPSRVPRSCCVPTKLNAISILYIDDDGVLTYRYAYNDMVVAECGCR